MFISWSIAQAYHLMAADFWRIMFQWLPIRPVRGMVARLRSYSLKRAIFHYLLVRI